MNKGLFVASILTLLTLGLSGCLGDDTPSTPTIPKAYFKVSQIGEETFKFDATGSSGKIVKYLWDFGDNNQAEGEVVEHTYEFGSGVYEVQLVVISDLEDKDIMTEKVTVGDGINLAPTGDFTPSTRYIGVNEPFRVDASGSTDPEGDRLRYEWNFNYLMQERDYKMFRERKSKATLDEGDGNSSVTEGGQSSDPLKISPSEAERIVARLLSDKEDAGHCHGPCAPGQGDIGWDGARSQWDDPVYDLLEGFPSAGVYYVKLTVYDIKGESQAYLSEQVWPVEVAEEPEPEMVDNYDAPFKGNLTVAAPAAVAKETPDDTPFYSDHGVHTWTIDRPVKRMLVNITWSSTDERLDQGSIPDLTKLYAELTLPDGDVRKTGTETKQDESGNPFYQIEVAVGEAPGKGIWQIDLEASAGADIQYAVTYWAVVDLTPELFIEIEAPYN